MTESSNVVTLNSSPTRPLNAASLEPEQHRGQLRFAERFTGAYGGKFLHVHGIGWHEYDGSRWKECLDGAEKRAAVDLVKQALRQLPQLDKSARGQLFKDISRIESKSGINGVVDIAANLHPCTVAASKLDAQPELLNTSSGTIDLSTGAERKPDPNDHISKCTNASFNPDARSKTFTQFIEQIQPDPDMRAFLARSLGSALLGRVRDHVLLIWHGGGGNGKGTLRDAVSHALGNYAIEVPPEILLLNKHGQQGMAPERMRLKGARAAFCSEIDKGAKMDEATMKKLTGGDPINAKLLYHNPIEFNPSHTLFMLTNHLPQVRGDDPAVWRRILAVPFDITVPRDKQDGDLSEKLKKSADAVLAWLWEGWLDYQKNGLNPPRAVAEATRKYQLDSDILARFLADEEAVLVGHGMVLSSALYKAFTEWARQQGEQDASMTNKAMTVAMEARGYRRKKASAGQMWQGLCLKDVVVDDPENDH